MRAAGNTNSILSLSVVAMLLSNVNNRHSVRNGEVRSVESDIRLIDIVHITGKDSEYADALLTQAVLPVLPDNGASKEVQTAFFPVV